MRRIGLALVFTLLILAAGGLSDARAGAERVALPAVTFQAAKLTVRGPTGASSYTPAALEALGTWRLTTVTPWTPDPMAFDGVLLSDILASNGLADAASVRLVAENDFTVTIPRALWTDYPVLIATRVNGQPHTRRARGPLQVILPMSEHPVLGARENEHYWVWMAERIEAGPED